MNEMKKVDDSKDIDRFESRRKLWLMEIGILNAQLYYNFHLSILRAQRYRIIDKNIGFLDILFFIYLAW